jgi:hypothetical protein
MEHIPIVLLENHNYLSNLPDPKEPLSKTWKKDLKKAIKYSFSEEHILGIFMNVYLHSKHSKTLLTEIYIVIRDAYFSNSELANPNLFFEFLDILCNKENDVYTYIYYILAFAYTKKSLALKDCQTVFYTFHGIKFAKEMDVEMSVFDNKIPKKVLFEELDKSFVENPFNVFIITGYFWMYYPHDTKELIEYIYNHTAKKYDNDNLLKNTLNNLYMVDSADFVTLLLFLVIYGVYIEKEAIYLFEKLKPILNKDTSYFYLSYPNKKIIKDEDNRKFTKRFYNKDIKVIADKQRAFANK